MCLPLHQRPGSRILDGPVEIDSNNNLTVARGFAEDVEQTWRDATELLHAAVPTETSTASAIIHSHTVAHCPADSPHRLEHIDVVISWQRMLPATEQAARVIDIILTAFDQDDVAFVENNIFLFKGWYLPWGQPQRDADPGRVIR